MDYMMYTFFYGKAVDNLMLQSISMLKWRSLSNQVH